MKLSHLGFRGQVLPFLILLCTANLYAQQAPLTITEFAPGEPEDALEHHVYYGDTQQPVDPVLYIEIVYEYGESPILGSSHPYLSSGSWFTDDEGWDGSVSLDTSVREIEVVLYRTGYDEVGGEGLLVKVKGIIIDIDDIHKRQETTLTIKSLRVSTTAGIRVYPNPAKDQVSVKGLGSPLLKVEIRDINGRQTPAPAVHGDAIGVNHLPPGAYVLRFLTGEGWVVRKIVIE